MEFLEELNLLLNKKTPVVVLLVGLPLSGKDTFLKKIKVDKNKVISRDEIILSINEGMTYNDAYYNTSSKVIDKIFYQKIREAAEVKSNVFINITHLTIKKRAKTIRIFKNSHLIIGIVFPKLTLDDFILRNKKRNLEEQKFISEKVFNNLQEIYEHPVKEEGFDFLFYI